MVANEIQQFKTKAYELHSKYEKYYPAAFFVGGFIFDVITLDRIDSLFAIVQQAVYLILAATLMILQILEKMGRYQPQFKLWQYNNEALHFIFGSLLSAYFLFYFVSSSLAVSAGFLLVMFALLVANEFPQFQKTGPWLKFTLFGVCIFSFLSYVVPVFVGTTNIFTLIIAICSGLLCVFTIYRFIQRKAQGTQAVQSATPETATLPPMDIQKNILHPPIAVAVILLALYFLKLLPPLPLSIQYIGIYHSVERQDGEYVLKYDRPWYRFWQNGAQTFHAYSGDKIICFARIFSPTAFDDSVSFRWQFYGRNGWENRDLVPVRIVGGRDQGFRGYTMKSNYEAGDWRVKVETLDGREIGRISFTVIPMGDAAQAAMTREFHEDRF